MFLKQYNYKPRSNSQSSTDAAIASSPPQESTMNNTTANTNAGGAAGGAAAAGRRRSSATEKFAGLQGYKRNSQDIASEARKASYAEQSANQPGILGGMWNNLVKGSK